MNLYFRGYAEQEGKRVIATDFTEDRDGERIDPEGVELKNFKKHPILLWGHDHRQMPIGLAKNIRREKNGITFEPEFHEETDVARTVKKLWGTVFKAVSIGFIPKEREGNVWTKTELLEISVVNVPANPNALAEAKAKGIDVSALEKEVPGNSNLELSDINKDWDAKGVVDRIKLWAIGENNETDWNKYKQAFAYRNEEDEKSFSSYKLPFADVEDGKLKAVWAGISKAQATLLAGESDLDISEDEKRKAHSFLGIYFRKFSKEHPEFKDYTVDELVSFVEKEIILPQDFYSLVAALRRKSGLGMIPPAKVEGNDVNQELLLKALETVENYIKKVNRATSQSIKTIKDVRRQQRTEGQS